MKLKSKFTEIFKRYDTDQSLKLGREQLEELVVPVDEEEAPKPAKKRRAKATAIRTDTFELADINKDPPLGPDGVCVMHLRAFLL